MTETEGLIPRPADVIGQLDYEIDKGGNSATVNAMIEAAQALRGPGMTDTVKPVTAWAIIDTGNNIVFHRIRDEKEQAVFFAHGFDRMYPDRAPHRVVQVEITPKGEG